MDYLKIDTHLPLNFTENSKVDWTTHAKSDLIRWERGWTQLAIRRNEAMGILR